MARCATLLAFVHSLDIQAVFVQQTVTLVHCCLCLCTFTKSISCIIHYVSCCRSTCVLATFDTCTKDIGMAVYCPKPSCTASICGKLRASWTTLQVVMDLQKHCHTTFVQQWLLAGQQAVVHAADDCGTALCTEGVCARHLPYFAQCSKRGMCHSCLMQQRLQMQLNVQLLHTEWCGTCISHSGLRLSGFHFPTCSPVQRVYDA